MKSVLFTALIFITVCASPLLAASLNFTVSEQNIVKDVDNVEFTFTYDPGEGDPPDSLLIKLDYNDDKTMDHSMEITSFEEKTMAYTYNKIFDTAGYFDAKAYFTISRIDEDGKELRDRRTMGPVRINVAQWKFTDGGRLGCIESTPAVSLDQKTIYVGSEDQTLYALHSDTGVEKWRFITQGAINSSPAVGADEKIYFGSEDKNIYCLSPEGSLVWSFETDGFVYSSPALDTDNQIIYIGSCDTYLYALDSETGQLIWKFKTDGKIVASPVISHDGTIYMGSLDHHLYAVNPDGSAKWSFDAKSEIYAAPALDEDGTIFFGTAAFRGGVNDNNGFYALSTTGVQKWFIQHINGFASSPIIDATGTVCVGSYNNTMYGLSRGGGGLVMYKRFSDDQVSSPALGSNDYLYAASKGGILFGLDPYNGNEQDGRTQFWEYDLNMPVTTSSPIISNNFLFVGTCGYENGAVFSFYCSLPKSAGINAMPAEDSPWPLARNSSNNNGKTKFLSDTAAPENMVNPESIVAPEVCSVDPARNFTELDITRRSISITFSKPMYVPSIYVKADPENEIEGYYGFTVEPFDTPPEDFIITWNEDQTIFTLTLPEGESFEPDVDYQATLLSKAQALNPLSQDTQKTILYSTSWTFSNTKEETPDYSYSSSSGCFISTIMN